MQGVPIEKLQNCKFHFLKIRQNEIFGTQNILQKSKFLDAGIQDVSTSISIFHDLIEMSDDDDGDESDKHI